MGNFRLAAPQVAKPQTQAVEYSRSKLTSQPRTPKGDRLDHDPSTEAQLRQGNPGNQAKSQVAWDFSKISAFPSDRAHKAELSVPALSTPEAAATGDAIHQAAIENKSAGPPTAEALLAAFAQTRMRDDAIADRSARLLQAEAFAFGNEIRFRQGRHEPETERGRALMAHELTHVAHQRQTGRIGPQRVVSADVLSVQFTQAMAKAMTDGELQQQMGILRTHLQNQPDDAGAAENLSELEREAYRRQESARGGPPTPAQPGGAAPKPGQPATPAPQQTPGSEEPHGKAWWWLHGLGLTQTKHENAEILRRAWGPPMMLTDKDGEVIDVDKLSDDEIIKLNQERRGLPITHGAISAIPSAPAAWKGTQSAFGKEIEWPARGKVITPAEQVDLAKLQRAGVTEEWAAQQAKIYRQIARDNPGNPTATLRAEWLEKVAARLRGGP